MFLEVEQSANQEYPVELKFFQFLVLSSKSKMSSYLQAVKLPDFTSHQCLLDSNCTYLAATVEITARPNQ